MGGSVDHPYAGMKREKVIFFDPDYVNKKQQVIDVIRDRLKIAQSRQKGYADQKRRTWEPKLETRYI
jgi:hypothetical protein